MGFLKEPHLASVLRSDGKIVKKLQSGTPLRLNTLRTPTMLTMQNKRPTIVWRKASRKRPGEVWPRMEKTLQCLSSNWKAACAVPKAFCEAKVGLLTRGTG